MDLPGVSRADVGGCQEFGLTRCFRNKTIAELHTEPPLPSHMNNDSFLMLGSGMFGFNIGLCQQHTLP